MQDQPSKQGLSAGQIQISGFRTSFYRCYLVQSSKSRSPPATKFLASKLVVALTEYVSLHVFLLTLKLAPEGQLSQFRVSKLNTFGRAQETHDFPSKKGAVSGHVLRSGSFSGGLFMQLVPLLFILQPDASKLFSNPNPPIPLLLANSYYYLRLLVLQLCPQGLYCSPTAHVVQIELPTFHTGLWLGQLMHYSPVFVKGLQDGHLVRFSLDDRLNILYLQSPGLIEPQIHLASSRLEIYLLSLRLIIPVGSSGRKGFGGRWHWEFMVSLIYWAYNSCRDN